jgi:hypothetical protein
MLVEQKQIIDRVKVTAYNAEEWAARPPAEALPQPHDVRDLIRKAARKHTQLKWLLLYI